MKMRCCAGAAGLWQPYASLKGGMQVVLFEHNSSIGKKLLVTGSGRANLSNENLDPCLYHCDDPEWMAEFLNHFGMAELKELFEKLGILTINTDDGWLYPLSQSAHSVVEILKERLDEAGVDLRLDTEVEWFSFKEGQFELKINQNGEQKKESFDALVLAAGGKAYPDLVQRERFSRFSKAGHTVLPISPALGPILRSWEPSKR